MRNAEAIETLRANYPDACYEQLREAADVAIDALDKHLRETDVPVSYPGIISALTEWLDELPSAQPDVIIACADCKHWICHDRRCGYWNHGVKPLMWCSQAERKENR